MSESENEKIDWIYLPQDSQAISLWDCLHDGELLSSKSNFLEQSVHLEINVYHLLDKAEKEVIFLLKLEGVESVRANIYFREYKDSEIVWREESISWREFESSLSTDDPLDIMDSDLILDKDKVALRIGGFLDSERFDHLYCTIFLRGKNISAARSDGKDFSLESLIELGNQYWDAFSKRKQIS